MQTLASNFNKPVLKRSHSDTDLAKMDISSITLPFKKINTTPIKNQNKQYITIAVNKPIVTDREFSDYIILQNSLLIKEKILKDKMMNFLQNITRKYSSSNLKQIKEINNDRLVLTNFYRQSKDPILKNNILKTFNTLPNYIKIDDFFIPTKITNSIALAQDLKARESGIEQAKKKAYENIGDILESIITNSNKKDIESYKKLNDILTKINKKETIKKEESEFLEKYFALPKVRVILDGVLKNNLKRDLNNEESLLSMEKIDTLSIANIYVDYLSKTRLDDDELKILDEVISKRLNFLKNQLDNAKKSLLSNNYSLNKKNLINYQVKLYETLLATEQYKSFDCNDFQSLQDVLPELNLSIEKQNDNNYIRIKNNLTGELYDMKFTENAYNFYIKPSAYRMQSAYGDCVFVSFCNALIRSEDDFIKYCSLFKEDENGDLSIELKNGDVCKFEDNETLLQQDLEENSYNDIGFLLLEQSIALSRMKSVLNFVIEKDLFNNEKISKEELIGIKDELVSSMKTGYYGNISEKLDKVIRSLKEDYRLEDEYINLDYDYMQYEKVIQDLNTEGDRDIRNILSYKKFLDISFCDEEINLLTGIPLNFMKNFDTKQGFSIPTMGVNNSKLVDLHAYNVLGVIDDIVYLQDTDKRILEISSSDFVKTKLNHLIRELRVIKRERDFLELIKKNNDNGIDKMEQYYSVRTNMLKKRVADFEDYVSCLMPKEYAKINKDLTKLKELSQHL